MVYRTREENDRFIAGGNTMMTPAGGTIGALEDHMQEMGHCLESVTAGTDKLCWIKFHTN